LKKHLCHLGIKQSSRRGGPEMPLPLSGWLDRYSNRRQLQCSSVGRVLE